MCKDGFYVITDTKRAEKRHKNFCMLGLIFKIILFISVKYFLSYHRGLGSSFVAGLWRS